MGGGLRLGEDDESRNDKGRVITSYELLSCSVNLKLTKRPLKADIGVPLVVYSVAPNICPNRSLCLVVMWNGCSSNKPNKCNQKGLIYPGYSDCAQHL